MKYATLTRTGLSVSRLCLGTMNLGRIVGPRTPKQLENCVATRDITPPSDFAGRLEKIWSGPGGESPEAYSW
jgi:aryl-alcohol dehydrogenase-like predicted oxidoreductase